MRQAPLDARLHGRWRPRRGRFDEAGGRTAARRRAAAPFCRQAANPTRVGRRPRQTFGEAGAEEAAIPSRWQHDAGHPGGRCRRARLRSSCHQSRCRTLGAPGGLSPLAAGSIAGQLPSRSVVAVDDLLPCGYPRWSRHMLNLFEDDPNLKELSCRARHRLRPRTLRSATRGHVALSELMRAQPHRRGQKCGTVSPTSRAALTPSDPAALHQRQGRSAQPRQSLGLCRRDKHDAARRTYMQSAFRVLLVPLRPVVPPTRRNGRGVVTLAHSRGRWVLYAGTQHMASSRPGRH
jgi:hypothetical protein